MITIILYTGKNLCIKSYVCVCVRVCMIDPRNQYSFLAIIYFLYLFHNSTNCGHVTYKDE